MKLTSIVKVPTSEKATGSTFILVGDRKENIEAGAGIVLVTPLKVNLAISITRLWPSSSRKLSKGFKTRCPFKATD